ncbi:hypothetical protein VB734_13645 [Synechococcus sp. BA-124 BA4]|nr:hypothetical protein [Synechococcus sp. BA-124 BA4]
MTTPTGADPTLPPGTQDPGQPPTSWAELQATAEALAKQLTIATLPSGAGWPGLLPQLTALAGEWAQAAAFDPEVKAGRGALEQLLGDAGGDGKLGRREAGRILGAAAASYRQQQAAEKAEAAEQRRQAKAAEKAAKEAEKEEAAARSATIAAERVALAEEALKGQPFLMKGWDPARKAIHYQHKATGQLGCLLAPTGSGSSGLLAVADIDWWTAAFPAGGDRPGVCWMDAASSFIEVANTSPTFRPANIRGRGVWLDNDRVVWNLGDRLLVDGQPVPLAELNSSCTYALGMPLPPIERGPVLSDQQGAAILSAVQAVGWQEPLAGLMVVGWTVCAIVGGALEHRPGLQLTAGAGQGKSTTARRVVLPLLGGLVDLKSNVSEAAIRQQAKGDSLPVLIDESEQGDGGGRLRAGHLRLLRCSYDGLAGGRGTTHGEALEQLIRYSVMLSGINATIPIEADRSRVVVATRRHLPAEEWQKVEQQLIATITPEVGQALERRVVGNLHTLRANIRAMAAAIEQLGDTGRAGDCYGALLAGAHLLTSTERLTVEAAKAWLVSIGWEGVAAQSTDDPQQEARQCLEAILGHRTRWAGEGFPSGEVMLGELVAAVMEGAASQGRAFIEPAAAERALGRVGVKVLVGQGAIDGSLAIANSSPGLMEVLERTPWAQGGHRQHLLALPGAQSTGKDRPMRFATDPTTRRAVLVPWEVIAGPREERLAAARNW